MPARAAEATVPEHLSAPADVQRSEAASGGEAHRSTFRFCVVIVNERDYRR